MAQINDETIAYIPLTRGKVAIVDAADFEWLSQWKWYASQYRQHSHSTRWYAKRRKRGPVLGQSWILMHRQILSANPGMMVDHRDGDGLNNCRSNLRECTNQQNVAHQRPRKGKYKGVCFYKRKGKWGAQIKVNYVKRFLGYFRTPEEGARAYDIAAVAAFGEFAWLNFPPQEGAGIKDGSGC